MNYKCIILIVCSVFVHLGFAFENHTHQECPDGFELHQTRCWNTTATPYLYIQNKFMEDYVDNTEFKSEYVHKVVINARSGDAMDTPLSNISVTVLPATSSKEPLEIIVTNLFSGVVRKHSLTIENPLVAYSDMFGKIYLAIKPSNSKLRVPSLYAQASFMSTNEYILIKPDSAFLHQLLHITQQKTKPLLSLGHRLWGTTRKGLELSNSTAYEIPSNRTERTTKKTVAADMSLSSIIPNLALPLLLLPESENNFFPSFRQQHYKRSINGAPYPKRSWQNAQFSANDWYEPYSNVLDTPIVNVATLSTVQNRKRNSLHRKLDKMPVSWSLDFNAKQKRHSKRSTFYTESHSPYHLYKRELDHKPELTVSTTRFVQMLANAHKFTMVRVDSAELSPNASLFDGTLLNSTTAKKQNKCILGFKALIRKGNRFWMTVVDSANEAQELLIGILRKFGIRMKALFRALVSLFRWEDVLTTSTFIETHLLRMPRFLEDNYRKSTDGMKSWAQSKLIVPVSEKAKYANDSTNINELLQLPPNSDVTIADLASFQSSSSYKRFDKRSLSNDEPEKHSLVAQNTGKNLKRVTVNSDIQSTYLLDRVAADFTQKPESSSPLLVEEEDQKTWGEIIVNIRNHLNMLSEWSHNETVKVELEIVKRDFEQGLFHMHVKKILNSGWRLLKLQSSFLLESLLVFIRATIYGFIAICDKIMRTHINLPWITKFYEKVVTRGNSKLNLYGLVSVMAALEINVIWKAARLESKSILSAEEVSILINASSPSNYLHAYARSPLAHSLAIERPDISVTRLMRERLSYVFGSVQAICRSLSSFLMLPNFFLQDFALTKYTTARVPLQLPFEFVCIISSFNFAWKYGMPREFSELPNNTRYYVWSLSWIRPILLVMRIPWLPVAFFTEVPKLPIYGRFFSSMFEIFEVLISVFEGVYETKLLKFGTEHTKADYSDVTLKAVNKVMYTAPWFFKVWSAGTFSYVNAIALNMHLTAIAFEHVRLAVSTVTRAIYH